MWWMKWPAPSAVRAQLTTPNSKSNIHCQMSTATTGGIAQMKTRPEVSSTCSGRLTCPSSRAIRVANSIVSPTATTVNATERSTTVQKTGSLKMLV